MSSGSPEKAILGSAYDGKLMQRLWRYVRPHWTLLALALFLIPVTVAFELAQPYLLSIAIDVYIAQHISSGLGYVAILFVGCVLLQALSAYAQILALQLVGQRSMHNLRLAIFRHVLTRRMAFFDAIPVGRLLTRMTNDVESINEMFASGVVTMVADVIRLLAIVCLMLYLDVELALITFITLPALVLLIRYARTLMRSSYRQIRIKLASMNSHVQEQISGIKVVQLFCRENRSAATYDAINADYREAYSGSIFADASMYAVVEAIGICSAAAIAWRSGSSIGNGVVTVGLVVAFIEYVNKFFAPIKDFSAKYAVMQSAMAATERIVDLLDTQEDDAPTLPLFSSTPKSSVTTTSTESVSGAPAVQFRNVHFGYRIGEQVLRGLNLEIARGQKVAIVGLTGSGKSTLIKLLTRLYESGAGKITIAGRDIRHIEAREIRQRITVVNQDVFLFAGTIADNVRLGKREASDAEVDRALAQIGANQVTTARKGGANAMVSDRGENLSAGERQLISFARALVRDPEILVLDEATAHVDPKTESIIEAGLATLMQGRTTLVIAHRLSTIRNADNIVVLAHGKVAEQGCYEDLLAQGGIFSKLEQSFSRETEPGRSEQSTES